MKFEDVLFLLILAAFALFLFSPNVSGFLALLFILLAAYIVYFGPYESKPLSESAGYGLILAGILFFVAEKLLGPKNLMMLLGLSPSDFTSWILIQLAPIVSILAGMYVLIDNTIKKEILGEKKGSK